MVNEGYLIVLNPRKNLELYENLENIKKHQKEYTELRKYFNEFNPTNYMGISRIPVSAIPGEIADVKKSKSKVDNYYAGIIMNKIITEKYNYDILDKDTDVDLFQSLDDSRIVYDVLDHKDQYEIIKVYRNEYTSSSITLGFDIGYWGGDHFSLIADTIITPMWHVPIREDFEELRQSLKDLNNNLLFKSYLEAEKFREYYRKKIWAETEFYEGEFCIIKIDKVAL